MRIPRDGCIVTAQAVGYLRRDHTDIARFNEMDLQDDHELVVSMRPASAPYRAFRLESNASGPLLSSSTGLPTAFVFNQDGHLLPGFLDQVPRAYDKRGVFVVRSPSEDSNFWMLVVGSKSELGRMGAARSANGRWYLGDSDAASLLDKGCVATVDITDLWSRQLAE